jgi:hypothetical protein
VDRASHSKGLAEEQCKEIHQRIVPGAIEGTIDIFAPTLLGGSQREIAK